MLRADAADSESGVPADPADAGWLKPWADWAAGQGVWWAASCVFHMLLMSVLLLVGTSAGTPQVVDDAPRFEPALVPEEPQDQPKIDRIVPVDTGDVMADLVSADVPAIAVTTAPASAMRAAVDAPEGTPTGISPMDRRPAMIEPFVAGGFGPGPKWRAGFVGLGPFGVPGGSGDAKSGLERRGEARQTSAMRGRTEKADLAVAAALSWLARHQLPGGRWSLAEYRQRCHDPTCTGPGSARADAAATALALLPFLAAGQTHVATHGGAEAVLGRGQKRGAYQKTVLDGLYWLIRSQKRNGDLGAGSSAPMYAHGLATIALCEAYGMSREKMVGQAAQRAVDFIQAAQHPRTGGWRYQPGDEGDTSVTGWQIMALKSAQMAYLSVRPQALEGAKRFLKSVSQGTSGGQFAYLPGASPTPTMTSVGLLCSQYLGARPDDPIMVEGRNSLMSSLPQPEARNLYYWYYAGQVMHNFLGREWDQWYRPTRRLLAESQARQGCAAGSWDPQKPTKDAWGEAGGRLMTTSLAALTLEVPYRFLPLYGCSQGK